MSVVLFYSGALVLLGCGTGTAPKQKQEVTSEQKLHDLKPALSVQSIVVKKTNSWISSFIEVYMAECKKGHSESCANLGGILEKGEGVGTDPEAALIAYRMACNAGHNRGCFNWVQLVARLNPTAISPANIEKTFVKACSINVAAACFALAEYLAEQDDGQKPRIQRLFSKACNLEHARSCFRLFDLDKSQKHLELACELGCGEGCYKLSHIVTPHRKITDGGKRTRLLLRNACLLSYTQACLELGEIGLQAGDEKSKSLAVDALFRACTLKDADACFQLGMMYMAGDPVPFSPMRGYRLLNKACTLNSSKGCFALGTHLENDPHRHVDIIKSAAAYLSACDLGLGLACAKYGDMLVKGHSVNGKKNEAGFYYKKGCALKDSESCQKSNNNENK